jgi:hypothetical protein
VVKVLAHNIWDRMARSALIALVTFLPVLASILTFVSTAFPLLLPGVDIRIVDHLRAEWT